MSPNRRTRRAALTVTSVLMLVVGGLAAGQAPKAGAPGIKEQEVAPAFASGTLLTLSPKGMRVASTRAKANGKWIVQLDGVESPEYDEVLKTVPTPEMVIGQLGEILTYNVGVQGPVAFSPDGRRYAYAARVGENVMLIVDGKEMFRGKMSLAAPPVQLLQFTLDSRRVYFYSADGTTLNSRVLMMDGKPVSPSLADMRPLLFSADGSHWVLTAGHAAKPAERVVIVDGKTLPYSCENARISPDGLHIACVSRTNTAGAASAVLVDGKPMATRPNSRVGLLKFSPSGDVFATIMDPKNSTTLYRNGVLVPDSVGANAVTFSQDGKRWAAAGVSGGGATRWVMVDGKKQKDYQMVSEVAFSADGTTWAFKGQSDKGWHTVVNGQEREPNAYARGGPVFGKTGNRFIYTAGPNTTKVYYDGKVSAPLHSVWGLELSPDGTRYAYYAGIDTLTTELVVDGEPKSRGGQFTASGRIRFSPDSKHVVATAMHPQQKTPTLYIDGTFLPRMPAVPFPAEFTLDSQHLISTSPGPVEQGAGTMLYHLNGDVVAKCSTRAMTWVNSPKMVRPTFGVMQWGGVSKLLNPDGKDWEVQPDGSIIFVCNSPGPAGYGPIKKITVTPAAGRSVTSWIASLAK